MAGRSKVYFIHAVLKFPSFFHSLSSLSSKLLFALSLLTPATAERIFTSIFESLYDGVRGVSPRVSCPFNTSPGIYLDNPPFTSIGDVVRSITACSNPSALAIICTLPGTVSERINERFTPRSEEHTSELQSPDHL